jgi:hypothetical protein
MVIHPIQVLRSTMIVSLGLYKGCAQVNLPLQLSTETFFMSLMQSFYDEPIHPTELFTKSPDVPTELSSQ